MKGGVQCQETVPLKKYSYRGERNLCISPVSGVGYPESLREEEETFSGSFVKKTFPASAWKSMPVLSEGGERVCLLRGIKEICNGELGGKSKKGGRS